MRKQTQVKNGDYCLATKYQDGDPGDHWVIGFYDGETEHNPKRYHVVDGNGNRFRSNGFRRVEKITEKEGAYILANKENFSPFYYDDDDSLIGKSLWDWLASFRKGTVVQ